MIVHYKSNLLNLSKVTALSKINYLTIAITLACLLSSCVSTLKFTRTLPREIDIDRYAGTFQYISFYDASKLDYNNKKRIGIHTSGVKIVESGILRSFNKINDFEIFPFDSAVEGNSLSTLPEPLNVDSVKYFCSFRNTPLLLALEAFDIFYRKETRREKNDEGESERKADYYLVVKAGLSLYDSAGYLINRSEIYNEEYVSTSNVIALGASIRPSYSNKQKNVDRLAIGIGESYLDKYFPCEKVESRLYYTPKYFSEITPYISQGVYEKAIEMLIPYTYSEDKKITKRATHNLGVLYEALGNMEESDYWMAKSKDLNK